MAIRSLPTPAGLRIHDHEQAEAQKRQAAKAQAKEAAAPVAPASQPEPATQAQQSAPVTHAAHSPAAAVDDGQRIKLGDINGRLRSNLTGDFPRSIGFEAVGR